MRMTLAPDGAVLIEWNRRTWRFGLTIEPKRGQSGWYFACRRPRIGGSGRLPGLGLLHRPLTQRIGRSS